uniref:NADH dehydrogenase subunit 6 n=1 Tax=Macropes harringtonae TaxID=2969362 RepID=UPI002176BF2D|nr:NADH dehydrogenase subunit 6 [Macropes harringtonae]UUJ37800.1 NADH dehydrogenase subunit 6 [Macropes harringtonae]
MNMMLNMMLILALTFLWVSHPLIMAMIVIMQTIMISVMVGIIMNSFWFSYIILIMMLSGMLVLFTYMASIASNEKFNMSMKMILTSVILMICMFMYSKTNEEISINLPSNYLSIILNWLFSSNTMMITMIMVLYLFFTMIVVSKIVNINEGPLRTLK